MPERRSSLAQLASASPQDATVRIEEIRPGSMLQVGAWPDTAATVATVVAELLGVQDPPVFPPGRVAQTMIHHIDVLLHRQKRSSFDLWVLRSFAAALTEWLIDAG